MYVSRKKFHSLGWYKMISEKYKQKIQVKSTSDLMQLKQIIEDELETRSEDELIKNPVYLEMIKQGKV